MMRKYNKEKVGAHTVAVLWIFASLISSSQPAGV
jgi:hypothetical protein